MATVTVSTSQNQTAVTYAAGDTLDITSGAVLKADTNGLTLPLTVRCLSSGEYFIENTSTTTPLVITLSANTGDFIFNKNGIFRLTGDFISLGAAAGTASETFSLASAPLNTIPYPSLFEVETSAGSGEYIPYKVICTAGKTVNIPTTEFCAVGEAGEVIFWNATTQVLTAGNGTNGNLLPAGANVRIANIYIHSASNNATPASRTSIALNPTGTWIAHCVAFSDAIYVTTITHGNVSLSHCGFAGEFRLGSANANVTLDHLAVSPDTQQTAIAQNFIMGALVGELSMNKIRTMTGGLVTGGSKNQIQNSFGITRMDDCSFGKRDGRSAVTDDALIFNNCTPGLQINNLSVIGGRAEFNNLGGLTFVNMKCADSFGTAQLTGVDQNAITFTNCASLIFNGFGNAGVAACRDYIFGLDSQSTSIDVYGANFDGAGNAQGISENACAGFSVINSTFLNLRDAQTIVDMPSSYLASDFSLKNCRATSSGSSFLIDAGPNFNYDLFPGVPSSINLTFPGASDYAFGNFIDPGATPTTGSISCGPLGPNAKITLTGTAAYSQGGAIELPTNGDIAEIESLHVMHGVTSFINTAPSWNYVQTAGTGTDTTTAPTAVTAEFTVKNPGGSYGAYQAISGANLNAALAALSGYDSDVGFHMKVRFTATSTDTARNISQIWFTTNVDNAYTAPDGEITLNGPAPTDVTTMYLLADSSTIATFNGAGAKSFSGAGTYFGQQVYFTRRNAAAEVIMSTKSTPHTMTIGDNGAEQLFAGEEIQLANCADVAAIKATVDAYLDATISSRLATAGYTAPPTAAANATAVWGSVLETGFSADRIVRTIAAAQAGLVSGGPANSVFRNISNTGDQITAVADVSGNRTTLTIAP